MTDLASAGPLEGITVSIQNTAIGYTDQSVTDAQGKVRFRSLPVNGTYTISAAGNASYSGVSLSEVELKNNERPVCNLPYQERPRPHWMKWP